MRAAVNVLNILSSVASLAMVGYGSLIVMLAHFDPLHTDYVGVALGFAFIVPFLIIPPICVVASIRLARRDRRSSILVALISRRAHCIGDPRVARGALAPDPIDNR